MPPPPPVEVVLRRALKCLLRSFGLRCTEMVEEIPADQPGALAREPAQDGPGPTISAADDPGGGAGQ
jgi:hypothetical protein